MVAVAVVSFLVGVISGSLVGLVFVAYWGWGDR